MVSEELDDPELSKTRTIQFISSGFTGPYISWAIFMDLQ